MFQKPETKILFIKNSMILFGITILSLIILCATMYLIFIESVFGCLIIFVLPLLLIPSLLTLGYFWEMTASVIDRKTDIVSASVYNGKVKLIENIKLPEIKFFKFVWRGISGFVALIIMEVPVIMIFLNIIIFRKPEWLIVLIIIQVLIWFLYPGLAWNYAKNNSVFSTWNLYTAGHLLENRPGRYLWNLFLMILTWFAFITIVGIAEYIIGIPSENDINNMHGLIMYLLPVLIFYLPYIYLQHVFAFLIGSLGNSNDY
jgi:hypothetical protein